MSLFPADRFRQERVARDIRTMAEDAARQLCGTTEAETVAALHAAALEHLEQTSVDDRGLAPNRRQLTNASTMFDADGTRHCCFTCAHWKGGVSRLTCGRFQFVADTDEVCDDYARNQGRYPDLPVVTLRAGER